MNKDMKIQQYLDENLSGLYVSATKHRELMNEIIGGKKVKRKITVALALTFVLLIVALSALALTISELVQASLEEAVQQQEESGFLTNWTEDDKRAFANLLLEHDLISTDEVESLISDWTYPDDAMRFTAELAYGDMYSWTLEQSAWMNEILVSAGLLKQAIQVLPGEGELSQAEAEEMAEQEIATQYPSYKDTIATYRHIVRYSDDQSGGGPFWQIEFYEPQTDSIYADFVVFIYDQGAAATVSTHLTTTLEEYYSDLITQRGPFRFWTVEEKYEFIQELPALYAQAEANGEIVADHITAMIGRPYGLPGDDALTQDEALAIAVSCVADEKPITAEELYAMDVAYYYLLDNPDAPVWQVAFYQGKKQYTVDVTAGDGKASVVYDIAIGDPEPTLSPQQEALQVYEAELLSKQPDVKQWTLEEQAAIATLEEAAGSIIHIWPILPEAGDISPEEARQAAIALLKQEGVATDDYKVGISLYRYESGERKYFIEFYNDDVESIYVLVDPLDAEQVEIQEAANG